MSMTEQEIFDIVARHLLTQNAQSKEGGSCLYRGPDGLKCAVGCLVSDDHYSVEFEGKSADVHIVLKAVAASLDMDKAQLNEGLLYNLQLIHDNNAPETWPDRLRCEASERGLSSAVVEEFQK